MIRPRHPWPLWFAAVLLGWAGAASASAATARAPFLWHVDGPYATHYLLGAVHLLPAGADSLPPALEQAYAQVDGAVFETDIGALTTRAVQLQFAAAGFSRVPLKARIGPALYGRVVKRARGLRMPLNLCRSTRAWLCAVDLGVYLFRQAGFSEEYGVDQHFYGEAVADGKAVRWFESTRRHLALFTQMNETLSRDLLRAALAPDGSALGSPRQLYRAWANDDVAAVAGFDRRFKTHYPALYTRLIVQRNRRWMPQLRALLNGSSSQLVVVGAAHLVGPDGLVPALRKAGYVVEPGLAVTREELHAALTTPPLPGQP